MPPFSKPPKSINPVVLLQDIIGALSKNNTHPDDIVVDVSYMIYNRYVKDWDVSTPQDKDRVLQLLVAVYEGIELSINQRR